MLGTYLFEKSYDVSISISVLGPDGVYEPDYSQYDTEFSLFNTTSQMQFQQAMTGS